MNYGLSFLIYLSMVIYDVSIYDLENLMLQAFTHELHQLQRSIRNEMAVTCHPDPPKKKGGRGGWNPGCSKKKVRYM